MTLAYIDLRKNKHQEVWRNAVIDTKHSDTNYLREMRNKHCIASEVEKKSLRREKRRGNLVKQLDRCK